MIFLSYCSTCKWGEDDIAPPRPPAPRPLLSGRLALVSMLTAATVPINQIRELRLGQPPTDNVNASRWITIVYVRSLQWKVLHMIALTDDVYKLWVNTLSKLVSETSDRMVGHGTPSDPDMAWIRQLWPAGAKSIDWSVAVGLCRSIGLPVPQDSEGMQVRSSDSLWGAGRH